MVSKNLSQTCVGSAVNKGRLETEEEITYAFGTWGYRRTLWMS